MALTVPCPNPACGRSLTIPDAFIGKSVRCKTCQTKFTLVPSKADPSPAPKRAEQPAAASSSGSLLPEPAAVASEPQQQIGRFQVRAVLGTGAFGTVYRAYDPRLDREVMERLGRSCCRNPAVAGLAATVVLLLLAGTTVAISPFRRSNSASQD